MLRIVFAKTYIRLDFYEGDMSAPVASSMFNSVPLPYFLLPIVPPSILWYTSCTGCCSSQVHNEKRKPIMTPMDWSATAAWIALAISIVGTIASPIINSILNNRYQLKLHNFDLKNKYQEQRAETINSFLCNVAGYLAYPDRKNAHLFGTSFYSVYQYVPDEMWPKLDSLFDSLVNENLDSAQQEYPPIAHRLAEILKDIPQ